MTEPAPTAEQIRQAEIAAEVIRFAERDGVRLAAESVGRSMQTMEAALSSARAENERRTSQAVSLGEQAVKFKDERDALRQDRDEWEQATVCANRRYEIAEAERDRLRAENTDLHLRVNDTAARAAVVERERDEARRQVAAVEKIHWPRTSTVYSPAHDEAGHVIEDARCTDACFEPWRYCDGDGCRWPCSTAAALAAAQPTEATA